MLLWNVGRVCLKPFTSSNLLMCELLTHKGSCRGELGEDADRDAQLKGTPTITAP